MAEPGLRFWLTHFVSADSGHDDCHIFVATQKCQVKAVRFARHKDEYGDVACVVTRTQSTEAPASGDSLITSVDMEDLTANTTTTSAVTTTGGINVLEVGDRVSLNFTAGTFGGPYAGNWTITVEMEQVFT